MLKNFISFCLIAILLIPVVYSNALSGDAELVLENIYIDPPHPQIGDTVKITGEFYNAGLKNTNSFASMITIAYFIDDILLHVDGIDNVKPGISNKIQSSYSTVWASHYNVSEIKIVLDYHNTLKDEYDSPVNNILNKSFFSESLKSSTLLLHISPTYLTHEKNMLDIIISLTDSNTKAPLHDKKITLTIGDKKTDLFTGKKESIIISSPIHSLGSIEIQSSFEGDSLYFPSYFSDTVYSFPKEETALLIKLNDPKNQFDFENSKFDFVIFQNSYDTLIEKVNPNMGNLLDSVTFFTSLSPGHEYFAEIYLDGRLLFVTDKFLLEENNLVIKELKIPELAEIKFEVFNSENQLVNGTTVKNWIYSSNVENGYTNWMSVLPTVYGQPYIAEVFINDQKLSESEPFFLLSGERKIISIQLDKSLSDHVIPSWIKNNAGWWANGDVDDNSFVQGIQFLIENGIMKIPPTAQGSGSGSNDIPSWIKNNAGWWANGDVDDNSFVQGIQFLIENGIMKISIS